MTGVLRATFTGQIKMRYLLDTNILSEVMRAQPNPRVLERLEKYSNSSVTSATVWHELRFGCERLPASRRRRALETYLDDLEASRFRILPYDRLAAHLHGQLRAELQRQGLGASLPDGEIAAVALLHNLIVVTNNTRHFEVFPDLQLEDWFG